ncbi:EF hand protein (macronuclear) [Tetrahymena thermophila SB210]|uniref:EF hand protein n=1 Tax=Tetrahymena thermophila (strain SB210) TaxID=312017 RepID=Q23TZ4_TETTS|nr:EF hand protein [Tetrahymena thermophila SB210]EAR99987.2 EF hand protein [Tetrahymena thermophila SB210]|eukprot:XP_001020232.2 EF hand protein [Tetrahymena thermophila SB210]
MSNQTQQDDNEYVFENLNEYQAFVKNNKRTKLHNKSTVSWLKTRYSNKTKKHYLLFPEELIEDMKIRKIFKIFDKDGSQALDLKEMVEMFQKYNIEIDKEELQQIYNIVDKTKDNALNYLEFKECAISQDANAIFSKMISKVRTQEQQKKSAEERNIYLPQRFSEMVTYLSYRINREDLEDYLRERNHRISERYEKYLQLMNLNGLDSAGATAHENQIKDQKKLDKASDLEQKIFDRQSSSDSDGESLEAEKSFRNQIKEEQLKKQQKAQYRLSQATNSVNRSQPHLMSTSPRHGSLQIELQAQNSNYFLQSSVAGAQTYGTQGSNYNNSNSQLAASRGSIRNSKIRTQGKKEMDEEQIHNKFTKYEAQSLSKKAQLKGKDDAQNLYTEVSKQYGTQENFYKTFQSTQNWQNANNDTQAGLKNKTQLQTDETDSQLGSVENKKSAERSNLLPLSTTFQNHRGGIGKFFGSNGQDFESTQNSQNINNNIYGTRQKYSNDDFRHTDFKGFNNKSHNQLGTMRSVSQFMTSKNKFNSTFYTLGKRPTTNQSQLKTLGIDKSSFKSICNIMNKTLLQLENKKITNNLFIKTAPSSTRFSYNKQNQENKVQNMSQKLLNQNIENNIIDPKLMQSIYKPNQIQEYQEREKQLINEIKQDIMNKFLMNNQVAVSLFEDLQKSNQKPYYKVNHSITTEQSFLKQNRLPELDMMNKVYEKDKTPIGKHMNNQLDSKYLKN